MEQPPSPIEMLDDALNRLLRELGRKPIDTARPQPYYRRFERRPR